MRLPRRPKRATPGIVLAATPPKRAGPRSVSARTLGGVQDKGTSEVNLSRLSQPPVERVSPSRSRWAANDILPALTRRIVELEEELVSLHADLAAEQRRLATYAESDRSLDHAVADGYRSADTVLRRAGAEADEVLSSAAHERRLLVSEVQHLRQERDELRDEVESLRGGELSAVSPAVEAPPAFDLQTAIAEEMRVLLVEIVSDFRSRIAPPPPPVTDAQIAPPPIPEETVEPVQTAPPPADAIETDGSLVEHVDDLVRPTSEPIVDEYVEELRHGEVAE